MGSSFWLPSEKAEHGIEDTEPKARWSRGFPLALLPPNSPTGKGRKVFTPKVTEAPSVLGRVAQVAPGHFPCPHTRLFSALRVADGNLA